MFFNPNEKYKFLKQELECNCYINLQNVSTDTNKCNRYRKLSVQNVSSPFL